MRRPVIGTALLALVLVTSPATADPSDPVPSRDQVRQAQQRAERAADDVASVQALIDAANADLEAAAVAAQQAAEAYNGARWRLQEARSAEREAERASRRAARVLAVAKHDYRDAVLGAFVAQPELDALGAMLQADGLPELLDRSVTAEIAQTQFERQRAAYEAALADAEAAEEEAAEATTTARDAAEEALAAKDDAEAAVAAAAAAADSAAADKTRLLRRLAHLEGISVRLAERRQAVLEQRRQEQAALEAQQAEEAEEAAQQRAEQRAQQQAQDTAEQQEEPADDSAADEPADAPEPPAQAPAAPPADGRGASAAIAFARAQLGEPYRWAAAGPAAWDCSGLTMGAWAAGGTSLPHYSVAQYEQSTPIPVGDLRPGDLVFWGSSSNPGSIYHVALYVGDGRIIHAPRTGRPVTEESMYYWIPPTHFARP